MMGEAASRALVSRAFQSDAIAKFRDACDETKLVQTHVRIDNVDVPYS